MKKTIIIIFIIITASILAEMIRYKYFYSPGKKEEIIIEENKPYTWIPLVNN